MATPLRFDGQVVIVTGAGRGLGRSHALLLASRGARVVVNDLGCGPLNPASPVEPGVAEGVAAELRALGGEAVASDTDVVTDADGVVATALDEWGRLDAVVNNAGIVGVGHFTERSAEMFDAMLHVHALGTINLTRAAWPHLASVGGRVVNTTSGAVVGLPDQTDYATAKGAVLAFTRTAAIDGRRDRIRVNAIMPVAQTRMWHAVQHESGTDTGEAPAAMAAALPPEAVSPVVAWLAHESVPFSGEVFEAAGGFASRMVLAFGPPVVGTTPEDYAMQQDALFSSTELAAPADLNELISARLEAIARYAPHLGTSVAR